jgi:hypothetical protein
VSPSREQLMQWYRQFGFRRVSAVSREMVRGPRSIA